jgi:hypothetical protein
MGVVSLERPSTGGDMYMVGGNTPYGGIEGYSTEGDVFVEPAGANAGNTAEVYYRVPYLSPDEYWSTFSDFEYGFMAIARMHLGLAGYADTQTLASFESTSSLYAVGGTVSPSGNGLDSVERWMRQSKEWTVMAAMSTARRNLGVAVLGAYLYAVGGQTTSATSTALATAERYSINTDTWTSISAMPDARTAHGLAALDGYLYAVGGIYNTGTPRNDVLRYNPDLNAWTAVASMSVARSNFGLAAYNGKLFAAGGLHGSAGTVLSSVEIYDVHDNTWGSAPPMSIARYDLGLAEHRGYIWAIGGSSENPTTVLDTVEVLVW